MKKNISKRIKQLSEIRNLIQLPGQIPVHRVRQASEAENRQCPPGMSGLKNNHEYRYQYQPYDRQHIGYIPDIREQFSDSFLQENPVPPTVSPRQKHFPAALCLIRRGDAFFLLSFSGGTVRV